MEDVVGPYLTLLGQFFIGYRISFGAKLDRVGIGPELLLKEDYEVHGIVRRVVSCISTRGGQSRALLLTAIVCRSAPYHLVALPVSLVFSMFLSFRGSALNSAMLTPVAVVAGLVTITEILEAFAFARAIGFPLLIYGVIISAVGSLIGAWISR